MTATKSKVVKHVSQEAENFIKGLYVVQESNTARKTDCSKSNMSRYFVTVFFKYCNKILFTRKNLSLFEQGTMSHIIVTMKIDNEQITSVRKAGLTIYESLLLGTQKSVRCLY